MSEDKQRTFVYKGIDWHHVITFYPDRVVCLYDKWGGGLETSETEIAKHELREKLHKRTTFGWKAAKCFRGAGMWFILFLGFRYLFDNWVAHISWIFLLFSAGALGYGIFRLRQLTWLSIMRKDGSRPITFDISSKKQKAIHEFEAYFSEYVQASKSPNNFKADD